MLRLGREFTMFETRARLVGFLMFCTTPGGFFAQRSAVILFTRARGGSAHTRERKGDTRLKRSFKTILRPLPTQFPVVRIRVLCARSRGCLLCASPIPKHWTWLPAEFVEKHWGWKGPKRRGALS